MLLFNARDQVVVRRREGSEAVTFERVGDVVIVDPGDRHCSHRRVGLVNSRVDRAAHNAVVLEGSDGGHGQGVDGVGAD
jgi:hypothetical protein